ncbi:MAG TPA: TetR family transcriptional regulator [Longimicrobiales bacterium]|nr:TetR family transcriptional regulator [Longimicrobiales bacterium]
MPRDASITHTRILDAAHALILQRGFAGTSVDDILGGAGISRGTFFYHFPTKDDMARELLARHAADDIAMTDSFMERAERLARDPLEQLLVFLGLYLEMLADAEDPARGCLFASFSYEAGLFDEETTSLIERAVDHWRDRVGGKIQEAMDRHPLRVDTDAGTLADLGYTVFEGALIMARVRKDQTLLARHLQEYRKYLELAFGIADQVAAGRTGQGAATSD